MWFELLFASIGGGIIGTFLTLFFGEPLKEFSRNTMTKAGRKQNRQEKILTFLLKSKKYVSASEINIILFKGKLDVRDVEMWLEELEYVDKRIIHAYRNASEKSLKDSGKVWTSLVS